MNLTFWLGHDAARVWAEHLTEQKLLEEKLADAPLVDSTGIDE